MAVVIGGLAARSTFLDNDTLQLMGTFGVHALSVGTKTFVYAAGFQDDGISAFELRSDGSLINLQNIDGGPPSGPLELDNVANFASVEIGGATYLYANGADDDGISVFRVNPSGTLTNIQNISDDADLQLGDTAGKMAVAMVGDRQFVIASGKDDNGISVFRVGADGRLANTDNLTNSATVALDDAYDIASATIGGRTFLYVAAEDDNAVSVFELDAEGRATHVENVVDDNSLEIEGAAGVATAKVDGVTYLVASGSIDNGVSVFSVNGSGQLTNVDTVKNTDGNGLARPGPITTFTLDEETFVMVSASQDDALTLFHLGAGGVLTEVTTVFDDAGVALYQSFGNAFAMVDGVPIAIGAGKGDNGFSTFEIGGDDDDLVGTGADDHLLGLGGDDRLDGAGGDDRMVGGSGDDTYVVGSAGDVVEEHKDAGLDRVEARVSHALGENVEELLLLGDGALDGTGNGLANRLIGNDGANRLSGEQGQDELRGGRGRDVLAGDKGLDVLYGGKGNDDLVGGKGRDRLFGQGGKDDFVFLKVGDSGPNKNTRDVIEGFKNGDDLVLSKIDAVKGAPGNQHFRLDDGGAFEAGEIRLTEKKAGLLVEMNLDGDAKAEMSVLLKDFGGTLDGSDFVF